MPVITELGCMRVPHLWLESSSKLVTYFEEARAQLLARFGVCPDRLSPCNYFGGKEFFSLVADCPLCHLDAPQIVHAMGRIERVAGGPCASKVFCFRY